MNNNDFLFISNLLGFSNHIEKVKMFPITKSAFYGCSSIFLIQIY
jgi:hypothetical protein